MLSAKKDTLATGPERVPPAEDREEVALAFGHVFGLCLRRVQAEAAEEGVRAEGYTPTDMPEEGKDRLLTKATEHAGIDLTGYAEFQVIYLRNRIYLACCNAFDSAVPGQLPISD